MRAGIGRRSGDLPTLFQSPQLRARYRECRKALVQFRERRNIDAFWTRADKSGGNDACWPWIGTIGDHGYGVFRFGRERLAHRSGRYVFWAAKFEVGSNRPEFVQFQRFRAARDIKNGPD